MAMYKWLTSGLGLILDNIKYYDNYHHMQYLPLPFLEYVKPFFIKLTNCSSPGGFPLNWCNINMMAFCFLLSRRFILSKWKDSLLPTYGQRITEVICHLHQGKIRYTIRKSYDTQPFIFFVEGVAAKGLTNLFI